MAVPAPAAAVNARAIPAPPFAPNIVLVKFLPGTAASTIGEAHRQAGGRVLKTISGIEVQVVEVPAGTVPAKVELYGTNPNVLYAEPDYYRVLVIPVEEPGPTPAGGNNYFEEQWYLNNTGQLHTRAMIDPFTGLPILETTQGTADADIDAPAAWDVSQGVATTSATAYNTPKIAVLDSGADCNTLELQGKCLEKVNLVGLDPSLWGLDICTQSDPACDNFGHGTFVASEAAANTNNNEGIAGVGWNTSIGVFKVCYQEFVTDGINLYLVGLCPVSASAEAITMAATDQFDAVGNLVRSQYHTITMSYGSDLIDPITLEILPTAPPNTECDAVLYARNNGVVIVAGAGNNGDTNRFYPAACTDNPQTGTGQSTVIAVAASDHDDNRAAFSTYSTNADDWVSLAAPGEAIIGVLPDDQCGIPSGSDTCVNWWDGTSMATPLVAGASALVWADLYQSGVDGTPAPAGCTVNGVPCNQVVRARLENSADKTGANGQDLTQWTQHGRLNVAAALNAAGPVNYTLTVALTGDGSGTVTSAEGGINCAADCSEPYPIDTDVTLTAVADTGSSFSGWSVDCNGAQPVVAVTMDADRNCTASFTANSGGNDAPPVASFVFNCAALECTFDGSASSDDNGIAEFEWNFGDGSPVANGSVVLHSYASAGTYTVTLTVRDGVGQTNSATVPVQAKSKGKTKGGSEGGDSGGGSNCPPGKAAQGKC